MRRRAVLSFLVVLPVCGQPATLSVAGDWLGTLQAGPQGLRLMLHVTASGTAFAATLDSLDQGQTGLPANKVAVDGSSLAVEFARIGGRFEAKLLPDGNTLTGTWSQGPARLPLTLTRQSSTAAKSAAEPPRPQHPKRPFPYREEEVMVATPAGHKLAGTLTLPTGAGRFPAVLLWAGSGPQDRDSTLFGHKPFLVWSDFLTRRGFATLRLDERGVGKSTGSLRDATSQDLANDAEAAFLFLNGRKEIDPKRVALVGHSEGALIAMTVASRRPDVAALVLLAGGGVRGDELLVQQAAALVRAMGAAPGQVADVERRQREAMAILLNEPDAQKRRERLRTLLADAGLPPEAVDAQLGDVESPWMRSFVTTDPGTLLTKVRCPVLSLIGDRDVQVPAEVNLKAIGAALQKGGNRDHEESDLPGLNHLFQKAETGLPTEYGRLEETVSPVALERVTAWLGKRLGVRAERVGN